MGQARSCIQGSPDWVGPYEKPGQKSVTGDRDLYNRLGELILLSTITKDYSALEEFLANSTKMDQKSTKSFSKEKKNFSSPEPSSPKKNKSTPLQLEEMFHKDTQCKSVNFRQEQEDAKSIIIKPVIAKKKCAVHGSNHSHTRTIVTEYPHQHEIGCPLSNRSLNTNSEHQLPHLPTNSQQKTNTLSSRATHNVHVSSPREPSSENRMVSNSVITTPGSPIPRGDTKITLPVDKSPKSMVSLESSCRKFLTRTNSSYASSLTKLVSSEDQKEPETNDLLAALAVHTAKETIQRLEDRGETIVETFGVVLKHMEHGDWSTFCISTSRLCDDIRRVLRDNNISCDSADPQVVKIANHVTTALNKLTAQILQSNLINSGEQPNLVPSFRKLGEVLHELMEFLISKELTIIVRSLESETSNYCVKVALLALAEMTMSGALMCKLLSRVGAVKSLMKICQPNNRLDLRLLALRTLTTLCQSQEAVINLEKAAGLIFIIQTLSLEVDDSIKNEATALLAQVMKHMNAYNSIQQAIHQHINQLVKVLIDVAQKTLSSEVFLLTAASLSSLSSFSPKALQWIKSHEQELKFLSSGSKNESYV